MTNQEKHLLELLKTGVLDGLVGDFYSPPSSKSLFWMKIENGIPRRYKEGPGGKFFNGKENERYEGKTQILEEWKTDEEKLFFLKKFGWLMNNKEVEDYSAMFKGKV